jgi:predicted membrane-bound spermidine synthase
MVSVPADSVSSERDDVALEFGAAQAPARLVAPIIAALSALGTFFAARHAAMLTGDPDAGWFVAGAAGAAAFASAIFGGPLAGRLRAPAAMSLGALGALAMVPWASTAAAALVGLCAGAEIRRALLARHAPRVIPWRWKMAAIVSLGGAVLSGSSDPVTATLLCGGLCAAWDWLAAPSHPPQLNAAVRLRAAAAALPALLAAAVLASLWMLVLATCAMAALALWPRQRGTLAATALLACASGWLVLRDAREGVEVPSGYSLLWSGDTANETTVVVLWHKDGRSTQVFADGLELSTDRNDARLSEILVHPAMAIAPRRQRVLLIGGECGRIPAEISKYKEVRSLDLLRLSPGVDALCRKIPRIRAQIGSYGSTPIQRFSAQDWGPFYDHLASRPWRYDVIIVAPPHPPTAPARIHSRGFYATVRQLLAADGVLATRLGSDSTAAMLHCAHSRLRGEFTHLRRYAVHFYAAPSAGQHIVALASAAPLRALPAELLVPTHAIDVPWLRARAHFPKGTHWPEVQEPAAGCAALWRAASAR